MEKGTMHTAATTAVTFLCLLCAQAQMAKPQGESEWKAVEDALGRPGKLQPDGAFKFSMPRKDLKVTVEGTPIQAGLALGSWVAFGGTPVHAMVMGDLVVTDGVDKLQQGAHVNMQLAAMPPGNAP